MSTPQEVQQVSETTTMISMIDKASVSFSNTKKSAFYNITIDNDDGNGGLKKQSSNDSLIRPIALTWSNINVHLPQRFNEKGSFLSKLPCFSKKTGKTHLIKDVNGIAKPNQILAIMGASGAGKTTLLNALNSRNRGSLKVDGDIKVNGQLVKRPALLSAMSGYVQQDDLFVGTLTVKEHLIFQAMLRMDADTARDARLQRVEKVMVDLNLKKCENTVIGIPEKGVKGISGGEKRRLSFATEIITNPSLLFCDEPTSGLDAFMALTVVECMRSIAQQGKTIICTIHQPSSEIFEMFDRLCLLAEGRLAYIGDLQKASDFFAGEGYVVPRNYNPADYYIHKLAVMPSSPQESIENIERICDGFEKSEYKKFVDSEISQVVKLEANTDEISDEKFENMSPFKTNFFTQTYWLLFRNFINVKRDPFAFRALIVQTIVLGFLFGSIYFRTKLDQQGVQNINGLLFLFLTNTSFSNIFPVVNTFPAEIPLFLLENRNGMYRVFPYYLSKILIDLPTFFCLPIVFVTIVYWLSDLNNDIYRFLTCVGIIIIVSQAAVAFGTFLSAVAPSTNAAISLTGPLLVPLMIFSGFFLNNSTVPPYFIWLRYISWFSYANEALIINQWEGVTNIPCPSNLTRCLNTGEDVINVLDMKKEHFYLDLMSIGAIIVSWRILAFLVLILKSTKK